MRKPAMPMGTVAMIKYARFLYRSESQPTKMENIQAQTWKDVVSNQLRSSNRAGRTYVGSN